MKTSRFFLILAALLALLFLFPGCETGTTPPANNGGNNEDDPPPPPVPELNGTEYVYSQSTNTYAFLSVWGGALRMPESGDNFEVWEMKLVKDTDGVERLEDEGNNPKAYGTVTVSDTGAVTFIDDTSTQTGSGTIAGDGISMTKIPGVPYAGVMKKNRELTASASNPFGTGGPVKPQDNSTGNGTTTQPDGTAQLFDAKKVVKSITLAKDSKDVTIAPTFTAQSGTDAATYVYKEGYPARPKTISAEITWEDGTKTTTTNASDFIAIPHCFTNGTTSIIYYIGDGATFSETDKVDGVTMPTFQKITGIQITPDTATSPATKKSDQQMLEAQMIKGAFYEDQFFFTAANYPLQWQHNNGTYVNIDKSLLFTGELVRGDPDKPPNLLDLKIGSFKVSEKLLIDTKPLSQVTLTDGTKIEKGLPIKEVFTVKDVKLSAEPDFGHVLFDDPRLLDTYDNATTGIDYKDHWRRRLRDLSLTVSYSGAADRTRKGIEDYQYNNSYTISPPDLAGGMPSYGITYYGVPLSIPVPVYSQIRDIEVTPKTSGTIIMQGSSNTTLRARDTEASFIRALADETGVSAIYQTSGSSSTAKKVRRPLLIKSTVSAYATATDAQALLNTAYLANATLDTNVEDYFRNFYSQQYEERQRTQNVRVTFTSGGMQQTSDIIKIGVRDEWGVE